MLVKARKYFLAFNLYQQFLHEKDVTKHPSLIGVSSFARQHAQAGTTLYKSAQSMCVLGRNLYLIIHQFGDQAETLFKPLFATM